MSAVSARKGQAVRCAGRCALPCHPENARAVDLENTFMAWSCGAREGLVQINKGTIPRILQSSGSWVGKSWSKCQDTPVIFWKGTKVYPVNGQ